MKFRRASSTDVPELLEIYRPYVEKTAITFEYETPTKEVFLERFLDVTSRCPWLVCEKQGMILGYAYADRAFIRAAYGWDADFSVYLREEMRGRGLGRRFYALLERMVETQRYQVVYGLVTSDNEASCRFHEAVGYRKAAYFPDCGFKLGSWHGVTWYEKRLCRPSAPAAMPTANPKMDWSRMDLSGLADGCEIQLV